MTDFRKDETMTREGVDDKRPFGGAGKKPTKGTTSLLGSLFLYFQRERERQRGMDAEHPLARGGEHKPSANKRASWTTSERTESMLFSHQPEEGVAYTLFENERMFGSVTEEHAAQLEEAGVGVPAHVVVRPAGTDTVIQGVPYVGPRQGEKTEALRERIYRLRQEADVRNY